MALGECELKTFEGGGGDGGGLEGRWKWSGRSARCDACRERERRSHAAGRGREMAAGDGERHGSGVRVVLSYDVKGCCGCGRYERRREGLSPDTVGVAETYHALRVTRALLAAPEGSMWAM